MSTVCQNSNNRVASVGAKEDSDGNDVYKEESMGLAQDGGEVYTVDIDCASKCILFGGQNDIAEIYSYLDDCTITRIEGFGDSVVYTKFLQSGRFLIVTADGTVALMERDREVCIFNIGEDVSVARFSEKLVVGTMSGQVHLYDSDLEHINTFGGHISEVISIDFCEGRVLSMCQNLLIAHDERGRSLYTLRAASATAFRYITSDVVCFAREKKVQIFKENKKLFEYCAEDVVESVEYLGRSLVIGGSFEYLLLIDTTGHHAIFKLDIKACATLIKKYDDFKVVFSTSNGFIGLLDIRDIRTLKYYDPGVDTIFDFSISPEDVGVAGEHGFCVMNLRESAEVSISDL